MPFVEGGEDLVGSDGAEGDGLFSHGLEGLLELGLYGGERWGWTHEP